MYLREYLKVAVDDELFADAVVLALAVVFDAGIVLVLFVVVVELVFVAFVFTVEEFVLLVALPGSFCSGSCWDWLPVGVVFCSGSCGTVLFCSGSGCDGDSLAVEGEALGASGGNGTDGVAAGALAGAITNT